MIAYKQVQAAVGALKRIGLDIFGDALAMHTLHPAGNRPAMLCLNGGMWYARLHRLILRLPHHPFSPGQIDLQAHVRVLQNPADALYGCLI